MSAPPTLSAICQYTFAVIDPMALDLLPEGIPTKTLTPKRLIQSAHLMPGLIDIQLLSDALRSAFHDFLNEANDQYQTSSPAILVATSSSECEFIRHWNAVQLPSPYSGRKFWLRIHDSRVVHQMLRILDPMQRRTFFGQAHAFHYWIGNEWTTASRDPTRVVDRGVTSVGLAGWDWQRIEQIGIVNRALQGAGIRNLPALTAKGALAEQLIERATTRHGLSDKADLVEYTMRGLIYGLLFDENPTVIAAIKGQITSESTTLSDRFAIIDDEVWASLLNQSIHG